MEGTSIDLPDGCWAMIFNRVDPRTDWISLSLVCQQFLNITNLLCDKLHVLNPSIEVLSRLLQRFPNLKKISLVNFPGDLDQAIHVIARSDLDLHELDLSGNDNLRNICLKELSSNMKNLKRLDCSESSLADADLIRIADSLPGLEDLQIRDYSSRSSLTDEGIHYLSTKLKRLIKIDLSGCQHISDDSLVFLSSNCALLEIIKVGYCNGVTEAGVSFTLHNTPHLNSLHVEAGSQFESFGVIGSSSYPKNLQSLFFGSIDISDEFLCSITKASIPLTELSLSFCDGYTFTGISSLVQSYQSLKCLILLGANFLTDEQIDHMSKSLPNLTSIRLGFDCPHLSDSALITLTQRCLHLNYLHIDGTGTGREECNYDNLKRNYSITSLSLPSTFFSSSSGVRRFLDICPNLENLSLNSCSQSQQSLESLDIADFLGCRSGIKSLVLYRCQQLKFCEEDAQVSKLQTLWADNSGLDDGILGMIGKYCPNLLELYLIGCDKLTEEGVKEVVRSCTKLRLLSLSECSGVTSDISSAWIVSSRPSLRQLIVPAHLYPEKEPEECFVLGGCLVSRVSNIDDL